MATQSIILKLKGRIIMRCFVLCGNVCMEEDGRRAYFYKPFMFAVAQLY